MKPRSSTARLSSRTDSGTSRSGKTARPLSRSGRSDNRREANCYRPERRRKRDHCLLSSRKHGAKIPERAPLSVYLERPCLLSAIEGLRPHRVRAPRRCLPADQLLDRYENIALQNGKLADLSSLRPALAIDRQTPGPHIFPTIRRSQTHVRRHRSLRSSFLRESSQSNLIDPRS